MNELAPACRQFAETPATRLEAISAPGYGIHRAGRTPFLAFSADGSLLHAGFERFASSGVATYRLSDGAEVSRLDSFGAPIAISRDGSRIITGYGRVHALAGGALVSELGNTTAAAFSDDGRRVHCAWSRDVIVREIDSKQEIRRNKTQTRGDFSEHAIAVTHDERVNVTAYWAMRRAAVVFYDTREEDFRVYENTVPVALAMHPRENIVAIGGYHRISIDLFDAIQRAKLGEMETEAPFFALAFSPDGRRLAGASFGRAIVFDWESRKAIHTLEGFRGPLRSIALSSKGILAAACDDRTLRLFDLESGAKEIVLEPEGSGPRGPVRWLAFSPDGHLHSGSEPGRARESEDSSYINEGFIDAEALPSPVHVEWDPLTLEVVRVCASGVEAPSRPESLSVPGDPPGDERRARVAPKEPNEAAPAIVCSPNRRHWVTFDSRELSVRLLDVENPLATFKIHSADDAPACAVFSPDGGSLYVGTERGVILRFAILESASTE